MSAHEVYVAGIAQTRVGELWDYSIRDLAAKVIMEARKEAGGLLPRAVYVGNMLASSASHQANLGSLFAEYANLQGAEGATAEASEASGGAALRLAWTAVKSGLVDVAIAVGVEKATDVLGARLDALVSRSLDADFEAAEGMTPVTQAAILMQRYLFENHFPREALSYFPLIAHSNAVGNPNAMYRKAVKVESYHKASLLADPLNFYDVAPYADGAAAVILTRRELLPSQGDHPLVKISSSSSISSRLAVHDRVDPLFFESAAVSIQQACWKAGINMADLDFFEYSDNTTMHAVLSLEAAGLAPKGQGWKLGSDGSIQQGGSMPVATMGGHKARGFPLGAAGVYQAVEAVLQLRGEARDCQVHGAKRGMVQILGGTGSIAITHILERVG